MRFGNKKGFYYFPTTIYTTNFLRKNETKHNYKGIACALTKKLANR